MKRNDYHEIKSSITKEKQAQVLIIHKLLFSNEEEGNNVPDASNYSDKFDEFNDKFKR